MTAAGSTPLEDRLRQQAREVLKRYWGYDAFRPLQEDIILSVLTGHDTLGLLPTGGGKSITFQVPAMMLEGITLVVTPLVSLMKDQVDNLLDAGIRAVCLHSGLSRREHKLALDRMRLGKARMVYVSPERLRSPQFVDSLRSVAVSMIVVDEAHCISQWGYDFRPSYLKIAELRRMFPQAPVLALTASATPEVSRDIMAQLEFREGFRRFARSFDRPNISYIVRHVDFKEPMLLRVLRATAGSAIIYVRSRRRTREIAELLVRSGVSADFYHAGLSPEDKNEKQMAWKEGRVRVMVATNAFGMGIDKPDVRTVVHFDLPSSLEEYYQEAGRAGRDGLPAFAVLLVSKPDKGVLTRRINDTFPPKDFIHRVYELAGNFLNVGVGEGYNRLFDFNFSLFCQRFDLKPVPARNALLIMGRAGYVEFVDEVETRSRVVMLMDKHELYGLRLDDVTDGVLQMLLRSYTGLFADYVEISEPLLASRLEIDGQQVYQALLRLARERVLHYVPRKSTPYLLYTTSREEPRYLLIPLEVYERQRERLEARIGAMKRFAFDDGECRVSTMLRYFGEVPQSDCGSCDVCRARRSRGEAAGDEAALAARVVEALPGRRSWALNELAAAVGARPEAVAAVVRSLADEGLAVLSGLTVMAPGAAE